eukprot:359565-Chlamydomonas_euryale.AAC.3
MGCPHAWPWQDMHGKMTGGAKAPGCQGARVPRRPGAKATKKGTRLGKRGRWRSGGAAILKMRPHRDQTRQPGSVPDADGFYHKQKRCPCPGFLSGVFQKSPCPPPSPTQCLPLTSPKLANHELLRRHNSSGTYEPPPGPPPLSPHI